VNGNTHSGRANLERLAGLLDWILVVLLVLAPVVWLCGSLRLMPGPFRIAVGLNLKNLILPAILVIVRLVVAARLDRDCRAHLPFARLWVRRVVLAWMVGFGFVLAFEGVLALARFEFQIQPILIYGKDGGHPEEALVSDTRLLWRFHPGRTFRGRPVNNLGFLDRPVAPLKRPGVRRVICMGDSCTAMGWPTYTGVLHAMLTNAPPGVVQWEAINMAVHGYCLVQGQKLFHVQGRALQPDFVFLYYGWNDHWLSQMPVRRQLSLAASSWRIALYDLVRSKRIGQLAAKIGSELSARRKVGTLGLRVPPDEYRRVAVDFVADIRAAGAVPVLIAAPRAATVTPLLVKTGQARSVAEAIILHDSYLAITRDVARTTGTPLIDLAAKFAGPDAASFFQRDGMHLTGEGFARVAAELYSFLAISSTNPVLRITSP